ncbi:hypothetical protein, partial [Vibrio parahaemolyticus]
MSESTTVEVNVTPVN